MASMQKFGDFTLDADYVFFLQKAGVGPEDFASAGVLDKVKLRKEFDELKLSYQKEALNYVASATASTAASSASGASPVE